MRSTSYIELSESAIENNISFIHNLLGESVTFSSVVKGNAYGHSMEVYCPLAHKYGVRHISVSDALEAFLVKRVLAGKNCTLLVMSMLDDQAIDWAVEEGVEFYVFDMGRLEKAAASARKIGIPAKIHIEAETGMNRTGFSSQELLRVWEFVHINQTHLDIKGLCTHLAGAESISNFKRITNQQLKFRRIIQTLGRHSIQPKQIHMASSAASIRYPKTRYDLVRLGILQFGFFPNEEILVHYLSKNKTDFNPLQRVLTWKTTVMDTKTVEAGSFIGYGNSYFTNKKTQIAILPLGYSSGFSRSLSNRGKVLIRGKRLNVVGTVNMNMIAVDITEAPEVQIGDEVVLIGKQGEQEITVSSFSDYSETVNYELLTRLPQSIPRITTK